MASIEISNTEGHLQSKHKSKPRIANDTTTFFSYYPFKETLFLTWQGQNLILMVQGVRFTFTFSRKKYGFTNLV